MNEHGSRGNLIKLSRTEEKKLAEEGIEADAWPAY